MRQTGDLATTTGEDAPIPPCYVHLVAREDGAYSLNRLFTHLVSHLALYPRRPSIPRFSVMLEGTSSIVHTLGTYQYNTENRLVRYEPQPPTPSEKTPYIKIRHKVTKEELATMTYIPWQDGGVIRKKGKIPLMALLLWFSNGPPRTIQVDDAELSMVLKVTRPEFEKWPTVIERQSDFTATLEIPLPFEVREMKGVEGTAEPFIARVFLGIMNATTNLLSQEEKRELDERFEAALQPALSLRGSLVAIRKLIADHKEALRTGKIVRKAQPDPVLSERIDGPLRSQAVNFLEMAHAVIERLPGVMKFFHLNVDYLGDREERFARGCERNEGKYPELVTYLRKLRPLILEINEQFKTMRYGGWNLPNVRYHVDGKSVTMIEPQISGEDISAFTERVFSVLALAIEELVMYGFSAVEKGGLVLGEIPLTERNPLNAQRFKMTLPGYGIVWVFKWSGRGFYES
jgi:hypothetical protein